MLDQKLTSLIGSMSKYLEKALQARELFYKRRDEEKARARTEVQPNMGPKDAEYRFGKSLEGTQLISDNKWHMAQSRTFALAAIARGIYLGLAELKELNVHMQRQEQLLRELRREVRGSRNSGQ